MRRCTVITDEVGALNVLNGLDEGDAPGDVLEPPKL